MHWKQQSTSFPCLTMIARKCIAISGTSVPAERLFSKAGEIVSARRANIKSKNLDTVLLLNKN